MLLVPYMLTEKMSLGENTKKIKHFSHHSGYVIFWHDMPNTTWMNVCAAELRR
jgi:hypothetical protein